MRSTRTERFALLLILVVVTGQFVLDMTIPNGLADWVFYFIPVHLSAKVRGRRFSYLLVGLISFLMLLAFYFAPPGIDPQLALTARLIGIGVFWFLALLITRRKEAEERIRHMDRALRTIRACNQTLVRAASEPALLADICRLIAEHGGYRMSWVGFAENDGEKSVRCVASAGFEDGYLAKAKITWSEVSERGRGPTGTAIRTGQVVACYDVQSDPNMAPWRQQAVKRGYASTIALPLKKGEMTFGVLMIYAAEPNAFDATELELLKELADDMAFGIHALRTQAERASAMEALRAQEGRLEFLLSNTPAIIYSMRATGDFATTFVSPNVQEVLGYAPETFLSGPEFWLSHLHPDDAAAAIATFHQLPATGTLAREYRFRHANGTYRWMQDEMRLVRDDRGQPETVVGYWFDITARKEAEAARQEREGIFFSLVDQALDAVVLIDVATARFLEFNRAAHENLGYTQEEFAALQVADIEGEMSEAAVRQKIAHILERREAVFETRHRRRDGSVIEVRVSARVAQLLGRECITCIFSDVTESKQAELKLRRSEDQFRRLFEQHSAAKLVIDPATGTIVNANQAAAAFYGWSVEQLCQMQIQQINALPPAEVAQEMAKAHQKQATKFEFRHRRADGSIRDVEVFSTLIETSENALLYSNVHDITDRKRAEEDLIRSERLLREAQEAAQIGYYINDLATGFWESSSTLDKLFGIGPDFVRDTDGWGTLMHPDDRERTVSYFVRIIAERKPFRMDYRIIRPSDGQLRWMAGYGDFEYDPAGKAVRLIGCIQDITDRKEAEEALRKREEIFSGIVNQAADGIALFDAATGRFVEFNPAAHEGLGYTREEFAALSIGDIQGEHTAEQIRANVARIQERGGTAFDSRHRHRDGTLRDVHVSARRINLQGQQYIAAIWSDITESRRTQMQLQKLSLAVEQNPASIVITDLAGLIEYVNPRVTAVTGYTLEELRGMNSSVFKSGVHPAAVYEQLWATITRGEVWRGELVNRKKDGSLHTELVVIAPVKDLADHTTHYVAVKEDVTQAKETAAALEDQRRLLADVIENSSLMICFKDREGRYRLVNRKFEETLGRKREEILGATAGEAFPNLNIEAIGQNDREVMAAGKSLTYEETLTDATGIRTFVSVKFPLRDAQGEITGTCGMILDITDRKRIEEAHARLATAVEQAAETIVITDKQGVILYANPAFEKTSGYTRAEALGQTPRLLKSGQQEADFYRQMWETLERGETWRGHFINQRKDGSKYEEDASISPIRDAQGQIVSYVAVKHDVTHELQLEAQFRQAQKMEAIGTLAGGIAHDFNNILSIISGYGGMLREALAENPEAQEEVQEILKAADRARDLVQQILTFSRQREQKRLVIRLDSILKEATKFLRASLPANIQVELTLASDAPAVLADSTQIYQAAVNLGTNALHAMEGRRGRLTLKLEAFTPDEAFIRTHPSLRLTRYARLTVTDTGHGMDAKTLEHIFEPFFTTKPVGKGTGLGLAVVHGIVQSHDGALTVESQPGQGTSFSLYFPAQEKQAEPSAKPADIQLPLGQGQKILMVDDETVVTVLFQRLLKRLNYAGTTLNSPIEALALFRKNPGEYELVITDLTMPEMNGLEVAQQLHALRPRLPIILISGFSAPLAPETLREIGICASLEKPVSLHALAEAIQRNLAR